MDMEKKRATAAAWYEKNKDEIKRKARERAAAWRRTEDYARWLEDSRQRRIELKRKYRRQSGSQSRAEIAAAAAAAAAAKMHEKAKAAAAKAAFAANFIGPRKPGKWLGDAEFYAWRIANDPVFYAKELDRAQAYKARTRSGYKSSIIGWQQMPADLIASKHLLYLISKQLKRSEGNEKH